MFDHEDGELSDDGETKETQPTNYQKLPRNNIWGPPSVNWNDSGSGQNWGRGHNRNSNAYHNAPSGDQEYGQYRHNNERPRFDRGRGRGRGDFRNQFTQGYEQYLKVDDDKFQKYYCDRCDRAFRYQNQLDEHNREHIECKIDGCTFYAHPKIVQKHIEMQHASGLASKVMGIKTPEDIEKWKAERKRNFPTAKNIEEKKAALQEKRKRGEVLSKPRGTLAKKPGQGHQYNTEERRFERKDQPRPADAKKRKRNKKPNTEKVKLVNPFEYKEDESDNERHKRKHLSDDENEEMKGKLPRFTGTASWLPISNAKVDTIDANEIHISDEEEAEPPHVAKGSTGALGGLTSLMCAYGSDSDDDAPPQVASSRIEPPVVQSSEAAQPPSTSEPPKPEPTKPSRPLQPRLQPQRKQEQHSNNATTSIRPQRLTLLQKLLQNEIRHERNVLLQCVHYTLENNFFDDK